MHICVNVRDLTVVDGLGVVLFMLDVLTQSMNETFAVLLMADVFSLLFVEKGKKQPVRKSLHEVFDLANEVEH